jgi:hypothetical protein
MDASAGLVEAMRSSCAFAALPIVDRSKIAAPVEKRLLSALVDYVQPFNRLQQSGSL